jgi:hypothetical protein
VACSLIPVGISQWPSKAKDRGRLVSPVLNTIPTFTYNCTFISHSAADKHNMRARTALIAVAAAAGVAAAAEPDYNRFSWARDNLSISTAGTVGPLYCPYSHIVADAIH